MNNQKGSISKNCFELRHSARQ